jgi:hypothetical protein
VRRLKGSTRPVLTLYERMRVMSGLACVDFVTSFHEDTPIELLQELRPNVLVKGELFARRRGRPRTGRRLGRSGQDASAGRGLLDDHMVDKVLALQKQPAA